MNKLIIVLITLLIEFNLVCNAQREYVTELRAHIDVTEYCVGGVSVPYSDTTTFFLQVPHRDQVKMIIIEYSTVLNSDSIIITELGFVESRLRGINIPNAITDSIPHPLHKTINHKSVTWLNGTRQEIYSYSFYWGTGSYPAPWFGFNITWPWGAAGYIDVIF